MAVEMNKETINREEHVAFGQNDREDTIDLYELLLKLLDKWWIIAIVSIAFALVFAFYSIKMIQPTYRATSKLYVVNNKDSVVNLSDFQISNYLASDYVEVFNNWHVHEAVMQKLDLNYNYSQMNKMVSVSNPSNTRILKISVTSESPELSQKLANTYAEVAQEFISVKMETAEPTVFEEALLPTSPVGPNKTRNTIMGFLVGFVLTAGIIVLNFLRDDYIRTADDIEKYIHIPVLGTMMLQNEAEDSEEEKKSSKKRKAGK